MINIKDIANDAGRELSNLLKEALKKHMEAQPYKIKCNECGADLEVVNSSVDSDFDLEIEVQPCDCQLGGN